MARRSRDRRNIRRWIVTVVVITTYTASATVSTTTAAESFPAAEANILGEGHDDDPSAVDDQLDGGDNDDASTLGGDETRMSESENASNRTSSSNAPEENEQTLLDQFGDVAKEYLTQHLVSELEPKLARSRSAKSMLSVVHPFLKCLAVRSLIQMRLVVGTGAPNDDDVCHLPPKTPYVLLYGGLAGGVKAVNAQTARGFQAASNQMKKARTSICADLRSDAETSGQEVGPVKSTLTRVACGIVDESSQGEADQNETDSSLEPINALKTAELSSESAK